MVAERKMQVFVSSTYTDLYEERQAAVEAILTAGHIPAGMELFAAGDQSQLDVIKRWIDESDVFLLILGGRYGTIDPPTGKSYIHLEYEYAESTRKPLFAVVIEESHLEHRVRQHGSAVIETEHAAALRAFRALVTSRVVRFWRDPRDIKLAILETLPELARRADIVGWVKASAAVDVIPLADEVARLSKENASLRAQIDASAPQVLYSGLTFEALYDLLSQTQVPGGLEKAEEALKDIAELFSDSRVALIHAFWFLSGAISRNMQLVPSDLVTAHELAEFGLVRKVSRDFSNRTFELTDAGQQFLIRLRQKINVSAAELLRM